MFRNTNTTAARRAATATAGLVLIAGVLLLVFSTYASTQETPHLAALSPYTVVFGTWLVALVMGGLRYVLVLTNPDACARPMRAAPAFTLLGVGAALMLPMTLHALYFAASHQSSKRFHEWVELSLVITSIAHVTFAAMTGVRAANLTKGKMATSPAMIYGTTVAISAIPFGVLYMIPPILVAITGMPILLLLRLMDRYAEYDRNSIEVPLARAFAA